MPCFGGPRSPYRFLKGLLYLSLARRLIQSPPDGQRSLIQLLRLC